MADCDGFENRDDKATTPTNKELTENPESVSASCSAFSAPDDPELRSIVDHWHDLPDAIRAGIVAMVKASEKGKA